jgi:hypothetical protein
LDTIKGEAKANANNHRITTERTTTTMITLTPEQLARIARKKEVRINWLAGWTLVLFASLIVIGFGTAKNPAGFGAWLLLDVIVLTSAFIIKWAIWRLVQAWIQKKKGITTT